MRIESLKTTPDRVGRYWVKFDDGTSLAVYRQTLEDFGLFAGMELSDAETDKLKTSAAQMSAKMRAVRIVSASSVSKKDLQQRLIRKGEDPDQARAAVQWMEELDLLDDRKTAEQVVSRCIAKGYGIQRAKQALYEKQIPRALWEDALAGYPEQTEYIADFLHSRLDEESDQKDVKKAVDALLRRGHSYAAVRHVLDQLSFDTDEFPED